MTHSYIDQRLARFAPWSCCVVLALIGALPAVSHAAEEGLSLIPNPARMFLSFVVLAILIYPVQHLLLRPLAAILQQRTLQTEGAISEAERQTLEARGLDESIRQRLAAARQQGQSLRTGLLAEAEAAERQQLVRAREEATRTIESIRTQLAGETRAARERLPVLTQELAREAAAKLLGRPL